MNLKILLLAFVISTPTISLAQSAAREKILSEEASKTKITQRNADDSVRVSSDATSGGNFSPLDLGEWLKKVTVSDFVEVSSLSGKFENYVPSFYTQVHYRLQFVIRKDGHYFTAKCSDITDFPDDSHVMILDRNCRWWDEKGVRVVYLPFNNDSLYAKTHDMFFTYSQDVPRSVQ
jgi:hypothetical protein